MVKIVLISAVNNIKVTDAVLKFYFYWCIFNQFLLNIIFSFSVIFHFTFLLAKIHALYSLDLAVNLVIVVIIILLFFLSGRLVGYKIVGY